MASVRNRLTVAAVNGMKKPGLHADGDGLYLRVSASGTKGWIFRFKLNGRQRDAGLGRYPSVSLAQARKGADAFRLHVACGRDPIEVREAERAAERAASIEPWTFERCARAYIASYDAGWRNDKHRAQWPSSLARYVYPKIGSRAVDSIATSDVMRVLQPIWNSKPETASRIRGRIERVLNWAKAQGYRGGEKPAQWRGHFDQLLPAKSKVRQVVHHAAMPYADVPSFMKRLRNESSISACALEFLILTASRTGETLGAMWDEIDWDRSVWQIPGQRMKAGKDHIVPLNDRAVEILKTLHEVRSNDYVFLGLKPGRALSQMSLLMLLRRMKCGQFTAHGFRSSFRDWTAECHSASAEVAEMALAHTVSNAVEAAYRRGNLLEKRRSLMRDWGSYCCRNVEAAGIAA